MSYPLPKFSRLIGNAGKAVSRVAAEAVRSGRVTVDPETAKSRLSLCKQCEYYKQDDGRCRHQDCGCYMRIKTHLYAQDCPDGKW